MDESRFTIVGIRPQETVLAKKKKWYEGKPLVSMGLLAVIVSGCVACRLFIPKDPAFMDLSNCSVAPGRAFWFGTDTMGRDIFSMIWYGGRLSLLIGIGGAMLSTFVAILFGTASGLAPRWLDGLLMRLCEILLSVPNLLAVLLLQAILGDASVSSITFVIGITGWMRMAKVIRTEVRQMQSCGYVIAARCMGGSFFHILWEHLVPNFMASIMFMVVMDIRNAIVVGATLSFMGIGLPLEVISWGSMLSLAERALLGGEWWMILIPGGFLTVTLLCMTEVGEYLRRRAGKGQ